MPLAAGKYITYRLDSTIFTNFGRNTEIHSYQVRHFIESTFMDNAGRPSYRVIRYIRDLAGTQGWQASGVYFITPLSNQVEVVEDNLRFIKIHLPIKQDYTWKGNKYLGNDPYEALYPFTNDDDMSDWEYTYENTNDVFINGQINLADVVKVVQVNEKFSLDTVNVVSNRAIIPTNSSAAYLRGTATDTVIITVNAPEFDHEKLTVYNRTNEYAKVNKIRIPPNFALSFEFYDGQWNYPNPLFASNNKVTMPRNTSLAYIFKNRISNSTDTIKINDLLVDTTQTKKLSFYNKSDTAALFNNIAIPKNFGREFELKNGAWTYFNNINVLLDKDPYNSDLPFGSTTYSEEKYAKNIGLVYKELIMWDYQPASASKTGFAIKMTMIDHN